MLRNRSERFYNLTKKGIRILFVILFVAEAVALVMAIHRMTPLNVIATLSLSVASCAALIGQAFIGRRQRRARFDRSEFGRMVEETINETFPVSSQSP